MGKKSAGILTEMNAELGRLHAVVLGIGINVNHSQMPAELRQPSHLVADREPAGPGRASQISGGSAERTGEALPPAAGRRVSAAIAERWAAAPLMPGKRIRIVTGGGIAGHHAGFDPSGALRVRYDDGREEALVAGEVGEVK